MRRRATSACAGTRLFARYPPRIRPGPSRSLYWILHTYLPSYVAHPAHLASPPARGACYVLPLRLGVCRGVLKQHGRITAGSKLTTISPLLGIAATLSDVGIPLTGIALELSMAGAHVETDSKRVVRGALVEQKDRVAATKAWQRSLQVAARGRGCAECNSAVVLVGACSPDRTL